MIAGGGIGNMIDRTFNGETFGNGVVVDFIDFCAFPELWMWIFNVADMFVCVGVALAAFDIIYDEVKKYRQEKADKKLIAENSVSDTEGKNI
jgi:signal peptidase II